MGEWLSIGAGRRRAYVTVPQPGAGPGVLVLHAWWGLTPVFTDACDRLAAAGFVALAPDLYGDGATAETIAEAEALVGKHDQEPGVAKAILLAAADHLRSLPGVTGERIGVVGFSFGAYWALHLSQARPEDVGAVVAVYGTSDGDFRRSRAAFLGHFAESDAYEPLDAVQALESTLRTAGRDVTFHIYPDTGHWFVEPNRPDVYDAEAAALVWERTLAFLNRHVRDGDRDGAA